MKYTTLFVAALAVPVSLALAQVFLPFQQSGALVAPGSVPQLGEMWQSQWISGRPYSATVVTHVVQTFPNGTKVDHTDTALVYRDAQGRTRHETQAIAQNGYRALWVSIVDPPAGVQYDYRLPIAESPSGRGGPVGVVRYTVQPLSQQILANETKPSPGTPYQIAMQRETSKKSKSGRGPGGPSPRPAIVDLGTQTINGVRVQGVRITNTIPAGGIGNDQEMQVVTDRWLSPDLQVLVKSVYSDPRFGTTTYELSNISQAPPAQSLFQVPDGAVEIPARKESGHGGGVPGTPVYIKK